MSAAWRTRILSLAGRIILENGGETYRAEDTVTRMARAMGMTEVDVFGIPSGLFISYTDECGERETSVCPDFSPWHAPGKGRPGQSDQPAAG